MSALILTQGNALHLPLANQSVHCVVTSPPYFGLRSYVGVEQSCWPGGAYAATPASPPTVIPGPTWEEMAACAHAWEGYSIPPPGHRDNGITRSTLQGGKGTQAQTQRTPTTGATCLRCGCWKGTHGNEDTPAQYVWHVLLWLREVRRCLRDDGVAWVVLGDSYASGEQGRHDGYNPTHANGTGTRKPFGPRQQAKYETNTLHGALLGIPGLVHQAALADGWVVRDEVVWVKVAPMPESVAGMRWQQMRCGCAQPHARHMKQVNHNAHGHNGAYGMSLCGDLSPQPDPACTTCHGTGRLEELVLRRGSWRHTRATEVVLQLCKNMSYWSNSETVRESGADWGPRDRSHAKHNVVAFRAAGQSPHSGLTDGDWHSRGRNPRGAYGELPSAAAELAALRQWLAQQCPEVLEAYQADTQNPVGVLRPKPSPLGMSHYAAFPPDLVRRLILATCPERCCPQCGTGWAPFVMQERVRDATPSGNREPRRWNLDNQKGPVGNRCLYTVGALMPTCPHYCTCAPCTVTDPQQGWPPTCTACGKLPPFVWDVGCCLDPFMGSGTTLLVSRELRRNAIGIDASATYVDLARERLGLTALERWGGKTHTPIHERHDDLPLFAGG